MKTSALSHGLATGLEPPVRRIEHFDPSTQPPSSQPPSAWEAVIHVFQRALSEHSDVAVALAAIKALIHVLEHSRASTIMGLQKDLEEAAATLRRYNATNISLAAGCEMFVRNMARVQDDKDFDIFKARLIRAAREYAASCERAREDIAELGFRFVEDGATILTHGHSRCVLRVLRRAKDLGRRFQVIVTEGRPDGSGITMAKELKALDVPVSMVLDAGTAYVMERVTLCLVGAEGVVENGGIISKLGTYMMSICAKAHNIPVHVVAENYKFARFYPLSQADPDLPTELLHIDFGPLLPKGTRVESRSRDYTPPQYITLLITNLGVLTPAAVSDELIKLYLGEKQR